MLATMVSGPADTAAIDMSSSPLPGGLQLYESAAPSLSPDETHFADMTEVTQTTTTEETEENASQIEALFDDNLAQIEREIGHILQ